LKEIPILFSTEMVRAILEKRKTQTRRVVKIDLSNLETDIHDPNYLYLADEYGEWNHLLTYAPIQKDDLLYVREKFCIEKKYEPLLEHAGHEGYNNNIVFAADLIDLEIKLKKWKPSIFLPKKDSRIWLKVTNVRAEKLQSIWGEDAYNDGIKSADVSDYMGL
jgi:hypothetical protein